MYERKITEDLNCGITIAMKVIGAKWKPCIIDALHSGISRPSELHRALFPATPRVVDMQLKELEDLGIVIKRAASGFPLRSDYELTQEGKSLLPIIALMNRWGERNMDHVKSRLAHLQHSSKQKQTLLSR